MTQSNNNISKRSFSEVLKAEMRGFTPEQQVIVMNTYKQRSVDHRDTLWHATASKRYYVSFAVEGCQCGGQILEQEEISGIGVHDMNKVHNNNIAKSPFNNDIIFPMLKTYCNDYGMRSIDVKTDPDGLHFSPVQGHLFWLLRGACFYAEWKWDIQVTHSANKALITLSVKQFESTQ